MLDPCIQILPPYQPTQQCSISASRKPVKQYCFTVVDKNDGKTKVLLVGEAIARQITKQIETTLKPKRNWFMRLLEKCHIIKPLPDPECVFTVRKEKPSSGKFPYFVIKKV